MTPKMPRGAIPIPRSELAASEVYRPEGSTETFVPSGDFPSPNHELAAAQPYKPRSNAPQSYLAWPKEIDSWGSDNEGHSIWAEEAFAKACADPKVFIPANVVLSTSRECGSSNFAAFLQTHGFRMEQKAYLDGSFYKVDWTNAEALNAAIANVGPVKIGITSANLISGAQGQVTPGTSGWAIYGLPAGQPENHCASLCGYGPLAALIDLFEGQGANVRLPSGMPGGLCYAMFVWGCVGIVDRESLMNITGEAWVRNPTTIVKTVEHET